MTSDHEKMTENSSVPEQPVPLVEDKGGDDTEKVFRAVHDIPVQVSAVLGRVTMPVSQLLKLGRGAVLELDRRVGDTIDIYVNNKLVARGEVITMEETLGVQITEITQSERS